MRIPTSIPMSNTDKIKDEEIKKYIEELQKTINDLVAIINGDTREIEERLTAGGL